jgi:hypothetical protein
MSSGAPPLWIFLLSPEGMKILGGLIVMGAYLWFGWILPIMRIRDPKVKTKAGWVMLLLLVGIMPILLPFIIAGVDARRAAAGANAAAGTSLNASMGPQPVAPNMKGALPVNRPSAPY